MGFDWDIPSVNLTVFAIEHGHRNSGFTRPLNMVIVHSFSYVYQRVSNLGMEHPD